MGELAFRPPMMFVMVQSPQPSFSRILDSLIPSGGKLQASQLLSTPCSLEYYRMVFVFACTNVSACLVLLSITQAALCHLLLLICIHRKTSNKSDHHNCSLVR